MSLFLRELLVELNARATERVLQASKRLGDLLEPLGEKGLEASKQITRYILARKSPSNTEMKILLGTDEAALAAVDAIRTINSLYPAGKEGDAFRKQLQQTVSDALKAALSDHADEEPLPDEKVADGETEKEAPEAGKTLSDGQKTVIKDNAKAIAHVLLGRDPTVIDTVVDAISNEKVLGRGSTIKLLGDKQADNAILITTNANNLISLLTGDPTNLKKVADAISSYAKQKKPRLKGKPATVKTAEGLVKPRWLS